MRETKDLRVLSITPNYVIDYIVKRCFEIRSATNPPKLIDPACGSGGFLMQAIPLMSERYGIFMEEAINEFICGIDVNEDAIECAKLSIELFCAGNSVTAPSSFDFLIHRDSLMTSQGQRSWTRSGLKETGSILS